MANSRLRVYHGPDDDTDTRTVARRMPEHKVTIALGEILQTLASAVEEQRGWVRDFQDDEVTISTDLYEVILAYQHFRRPSA